jgi:osmotically-inducible protein OsmY
VVQPIPLHTGTRVPFSIAFPNVQEAVDLGQGRERGGLMQSSLRATTGQDEPSEQREIAAISEPRRSDDELMTRARSILRWKIRYNAVQVAARHGHVTLSGHVFSTLDREAADHTIRKMAGVVSLTNRIVVTSPLICKDRRSWDEPPAGVVGGERG